MDKLARRREYKEEQERKREAGEEDEPINPIDIHLDTDIPPDDPGALAEE